MMKLSQLISELNHLQDIVPTLDPEVMVKTPGSIVSLGVKDTSIWEAGPDGTKYIVIYSN